MRRHRSVAAARASTGLRRWLSIAVAASALVPAIADAHEGASSFGPFFRERYLVCDPDRLDHDCLGATRFGRASIVEALEAGAQGELDARSASQLHDAAAGAQLYALSSAKEPARRLLRRTVPLADEDSWKSTAIRRARVAAAMTLAALDDRASAPAIEQLVEELETHGSGSLWRDALRALALLDAAAAGEYAARVMAKWSPADMRMSMPGGTSRDAVFVFVEDHPTAAALTELQRLSPSDGSSSRGSWCEMRRVRIRIGDADLEREVRATFAKGASGTWVAGCDGHMVRAFGAEARDVDVLLPMIGGKPRPDQPHTGLDHGVTNSAYGRILELEAAMKTMPTGATRSARNRIRRELKEHAGYPLIAQPGHEDFSPHYVAFNAAALAGVGDRSANAELMTLIEDPAALDGAPWLAAYWALRLDLPGSKDAVATRIALGARTPERWRGSVFDDIRVRTLDAFVQRHGTDARWTAALLDGDMNTRERALYHLARKKTLGACDVVFAGAPAASRRAVEDAMLSLTVLGDHCRPQLERAIADATTASKIRGMAFEILAMMGSDLPPRLAPQALSQTGMAPYIDRADDIAGALRAKLEAPRPRRGGDRRLGGRGRRPSRG
jgi:hypothetical protein